jgi:addiction module RelB/DinJ family antitoxin
MKTTLHTKIDKDVKENAQKLAQEMGLPLSTIINSQLREFVRSGTFSVSLEPQIREDVWKEILQTSKDARGGIDTSPAFDSVDDALEWLDPNRYTN